MLPASPLKQKIRGVDWIAFGAAVALALLGAITMNSFTGEDEFFGRQLVWIGVSVVAFFAASQVDWRFLRRGAVAGIIFGVVLVPLAALIVVGQATQGARSWFDLGAFALQPVELVKLALIIALAKYFSRRHVEIGDFRHLLVSGCYAGLVFVLVALQPDFGSAIIIGLIWLGMVLFSGLKRTHLLAVIGLGAVAFGALWLFGFEEYQKQRIMTFLHPLADIRGAGYNAYQSTVAVGSGEWVGKGIGYGTQSKLRFLPEYQTDFIFASYAEEWGFVGVVGVFALYGAIFWRLLRTASRGATNFETLFALGVFCYFGAHFLLHVGINVGLLPVTGTTIPFMSYGGSHLLAEFLALGMLSGMAAYGRDARRGRDDEWRGGYDAPERLLGR